LLRKGADSKLLSIDGLTAFDMALQAVRSFPEEIVKPDLPSQLEGLKENRVKVLDLLTLGNCSDGIDERNRYREVMPETFWRIEQVLVMLNSPCESAANCLP